MFYIQIVEFDGTVP